MVTRISSIFREPEILRTPSFKLQENDIRTKEIQKLIKTLTAECIKEEYLGFSPQNLAGLDIYPSIILWTQVNDTFERISNEPTIIINPQITNSEWDFHRIDGCASINIRQWKDEDSDIVGVWINKYRPDNIEFKGLDINGVPTKKIFAGVQAHALHHELEHTKWILMTDNYNWRYALFQQQERYYIFPIKDIPKEFLNGSEIQFDYLEKYWNFKNYEMDLEDLYIETASGYMPVILWLPN